METTPPLPSGFNINGYLIQSLKQTDALCHVYYASDANHCLLYTSDAADD